MWQVIFKDWLIPVIALIIGINTFKYSNIISRIFFYQLLFWLFILFFAHVITMYQKSNNLTPNNQWLFNISLIGETIFLITASKYYFATKYFNVLTILIFFLFLVTLLIESYFKSYLNYFNYSDSVESIIMVILFGCILYSEFNQSKNSWYNSYILWISLGLFIYFACSVPYISLFDYLQKKLHTENSFLCRLINGTLSNIRYLFLAIGFWMLRRKTNLKQTYIHE